MSGFCFWQHETRKWYLRALSVSIFEHSALKVLPGRGKCHGVVPTYSHSRRVWGLPHLSKPCHMEIWSLLKMANKRSIFHSPTGLLNWLAWQIVFICYPDMDLWELWVPTTLLNSSAQKLAKYGSMQQEKGQTEPACLASTPKLPKSKARVGVISDVEVMHLRPLWASLGLPTSLFPVHLAFHHWVKVYWLCVSHGSISNLFETQLTLGEGPKDERNGEMPPSVLEAVIPLGVRSQVRLLRALHGCSGLPCTWAWGGDVISLDLYISTAFLTSLLWKEGLTR